MTTCTSFAVARCATATTAIPARTAGVTPPHAPTSAASSAATVHIAESDDAFGINVVGYDANGRPMMINSQTGGTMYAYLDDSYWTQHYFGAGRVIQ